jgi:SAM-dependent methyltransferase
MDLEKIRFKSDFLRFKYINKYLKGERVLDLASTEGFVHGLLEKNNSQKKFFSCDFKNSDFNRDLNEPFKIDQEFDTIVAGEIIEHIENPSFFIKECKKMLKKKGRLILTTPNAVGLQYLKNPSWCIENYSAPEHISCFTLPMIRGLLIKHGFKIVKEDSINAFWINNPLQIVSLLIKRLRTDLFLVADKIEK